MGSLRAQKLAIKVSENIRSKGKPKTLGQLMKEVGYSNETSKKPFLITRTKSFNQALIAENAPLIEGIQKEINRIKNAMAIKDLNGEDYRTLAGSLDLLTKNFQLLSGGATERQVFVIPSEVINRNKDQQVTDQPQQLLQDVNSNNGSTEPPK